MASLDENYAGGGFGHSLPPGRRPALIIVDFVMAYLKPGSPLYAGVENTRDACAELHDQLDAVRPFHSPTAVQVTWIWRAVGAVEALVDSYDVEEPCA